MWAYRGKSPVNSPLDRLKHSFWDYGNLILDDFRLLNLKYGESDGTPLQYSCLQNPMDGGAWLAAVHGVSKSRTRLTDFTFTFHFHALKEMATHSSVLAWRIPAMGEPGGLPSMGSHRVGHDWSDLAGGRERKARWESNSLKECCCCCCCWVAISFLLLLRQSKNTLI